MKPRTPLKHKRSGPPRKGPLRLPKYRRWIAEHFSILQDTNPGNVQGVAVSQACHTGPTNGLSSKASDATCVPLTPEEHAIYDDKSKRPAFEERVKRETGKTIEEHARDYFQRWLEEGNAP